MTFKKSYVPGILGSVLTLTVIMAAPVKAETKEETILNKTDWSTMAAANVEGYVNIRSEANADSEIVGVLMPGYAVTVTEKGDEWSKISSNGVEGYIKNEYLVFGEEAKAHYRNMCGITGVVQADSLRVREAASTDSAQVGTLTQNGEVSIFGEEADELRRRGGDGGEYGATTGRPRRMGWFDCVASKYGCRMQGTTDVAFTVLDVLGYLDEIPVCVGYEINGEVTKEFPVTHLLEKAKPVYKVLPGWKEDIRGIKNYEDLPENCRKYIAFIEKEIEYPITMISNGPGRDDIIYRNK